VKAYKCRTTKIFVDFFSKQTQKLKRRRVTGPAAFPQWHTKEIDMPAVSNVGHSLTGINLPSALNDIDRPRHLKIEVTTDFESLMGRIGRHSMAGFSGQAFYGTSFVQGARLQFTTAMPIPRMLEVTKIDRSEKRSGVEQAMAHANRPEEKTHGRKLRDYLIETACRGDKFILPSFAFNYGVGLTDEDADATLIIFASGDDGTNCWPAILLLPQAAQLDTTDGAHRRAQISDIVTAIRGVSEEQRNALKGNAVALTIIFESNRDDSHQDFADCGKAKPIPKSMVTTFDVRDYRNLRSRDLVAKQPFLKEYVDATASTVNLTAESRRVWSMNAVKVLVGWATDHYRDKLDWEEDEKTAGAEDFFSALVQHLPQLKKLDEVKDERPHQMVTVSGKQHTLTGSLRLASGGDVCLRGIGMAVLARALVHCKDRDLSYDAMARLLATINWHVLTIERDDLENEELDDLGEPLSFDAKVWKYANPLWSHLLSVSENGYRLRSSSTDADAAWEKIKDQIFPAVTLPAAAQ
jgi:hypothetical protein